MTAHYRLDPSRSRFAVQAFAAGMLSFLGHNPTFAMRDFAGEVRLDPAVPAKGASVRITVQAHSLELMDKVSASDRRQIEDTMRGETLEVAWHPEIVFERTEVAVGPRAGDEMAVRIAGAMKLHGAVRSLQIGAGLTLYTDGVRLAGEFALPQSAFHIRPVVALGGTIKLKDPLKVLFDVVGWKEEGEGRTP
jgi:polyisoprenoid-binding protein YceI